MLRVGVIGYGYWGPNLVRNFHNTNRSTVTFISDIDTQRLALAAANYPSARTNTNHRALIHSPEVDAVAIATPVSTHFDLGMAALAAGKHVFIEKPLTETIEQGRQLVEAAERRGLTVMVDHTFIYTAAVRKLRQLVNTGELGELYYYDSVRVNLGIFQPDVSVLWDLAVHDLAILHYVTRQMPVSVSATGMSHIPPNPINLAYLTVFFPGTLIAHIHVNWLSPVKVRHTLLGGSNKMVLYDDLEPSEKIKIYDRGVHVQNRESLYETLIGYRMGDMLAPRLDTREALQLEALEFARCIDEGRKPTNDGIAGLQVVNILAAATRSIENRGQPEAIPNLDQ